MEDAHLDESIYADALRWDPARHLPGREEGAGIPHSFLGWGSGLHPCGKLYMPGLSNYASVLTKKMNSWNKGIGTIYI